MKSLLAVAVFVCMSFSAHAVNCTTYGSGSMKQTHCSDGSTHTKYESKSNKADTKEDDGFISHQSSSTKFETRTDSQGNRKSATCRTVGKNKYCD
ncbi:hypothetical protein L4D76_22840 [Photobacterium sagamiensis]|uniref:hypothetical protein n=1 Tax=Photobacterium sagamiensis TaxID=2910241 RepID=UPI003D0FC325